MRAPLYQGIPVGEKYPVFDANGAWVADFSASWIAESFCSDCNKNRPGERVFAASDDVSDIRRELRWLRSSLDDAQDELESLEDRLAKATAGGAR